MRPRLLLPLLTIAFIALVSSGIAQTKAPDFSLKSADGKIIEMKKLNGKVIVVNFWATWCRPCVVEMPGFSEVYDQYHSSGLEIIGVSLDRGGWSKVKPFLAKNKISYPIVVGDDELYLAYGGESAIPTTVFVDKRGNIADRHIGMMTKEQFESKIKKLL